MRWLVPLSLCLLCSCSGDDSGNGPPSAPAQDAAAIEEASSDAIGQPESSHDGVAEQDAIEPPTGLSIVFDYKFDQKGAFADPARKEVLVEAARQWAEVLLDDFGDIPAGTEVLVRDPQTPEVAGQVFVYGNPIDDLVVFVGFATLDGAGGTLGISSPSAAIGSVTDPALRALLKERFEGADFEPWTGWVGFDEAEDWYVGTADSVPAGKVDFLSVVLHELGHILGMGRSNAYDAFVQNGTFNGPKAVEVFGGPVPLTSDGKHIGSGVLSDGKRPLMDASDAAGQRSIITTLDKAILQDIGYEIAW